MKDQIIIDVREVDEFAAESIGGSVNYPLSKIDDFIREIKQHADEKNIVLMCKSGVRAKLAHDKINKSCGNIEAEI